MFKKPLGSIMSGGVFEVHQLRFPILHGFPGPTRRDRIHAQFSCVQPWWWRVPGAGGLAGFLGGLEGGGQWWWTLRSVGEMKSKKCFGRKDFVLAFSWRYNDSMIPLSTWSWTVMISKPPKLVRLNSVVSFWKKWTMARNSCYPPFANAPELLMVQKSS